MTLKDIKAMFTVGQKWTATRDGGKPLTIHTTVLPEVRTVAKVGSVDLVWSREGSDRHLFTKWPKASEVIEARPGYLRFGYDNGTVVTLEQVCACKVIERTTAAAVKLP